MKNKKLIPTKCLRNSKTGLPFFLPDDALSRKIRKIARKSSKNLLKALNDPTGQKSI